MEDEYHQNSKFYLRFCSHYYHLLPHFIKTTSTARSDCFIRICLQNQLLFNFYSISQNSCHYERRKLMGLTESFCIFQVKNNFLFNMFTIFNKLHNSHCLPLPSPNVSQAFPFWFCENFLVLIQNMLQDTIIQLFESLKYLVI